MDWMETRLKQGDLGVETLADLKSKCDLKDMGISLVRRRSHSARDCA